MSRRLSDDHPRRKFARPIVVQLKQPWEVSPQARSVLDYLVSRGRSCDASLAEISEAIGGNRTTAAICGYVRELREAGLICVERRGKNLPNRYELLVDELVPA